MGDRRDEEDTRWLELVHSDVCGKMDVKSLGGAEYFVTFLDNHSRYSWVYPMKKKGEVLKISRNGEQK